MTQSHKTPSSFTPLSVAIGHFIRNCGFEGKLRERNLLNRWDEIVGEPISSHTRPDTIRFGTLHVVVDSSAWLQQLTFLKPELIRKIENHTEEGTVKDIVFRLGSKLSSHSSAAVTQK
tara:strand:+ start:1146 stop:1499 length:354 start_codon:yes stop_codon:yes gene_type:complete